MQVLCNVASKDKNKSKIMQCIQASVKRTNVEYFTTTEGFRERLRVNLSEKTVAVVSATKEIDLVDLYFIQHLLSKVMLILLLPDNRRQTIAMGHRLHPFFMYSADIKEQDLTEALTNIIHHGYAPKNIPSFMNPFEELMPQSQGKVHYDPWISAAA